MTTPGSQARFREWLNEEIERWSDDAKESQTSPNSYGAGYDSGYRDGLKAVREYFTGE